ncbi:hypothetical protein [Luteibacter sp. E-22]|uniref:hypothetical protein n=1 Tax=Luteibacter sp. E-22 TaxID=3404050 RepID=UPI003CE83E3C
MPKTLNDSLPWIAIALAIAVGTAYFATRPQPETFDTCMARLARPNDGEADRALTRAACAGRPGAPLKSSPSR